jgi:uncharacterized SAM-binding protein YcdF (DUF218 family)
MAGKYRLFGHFSARAWVVTLSALLLASWILWADWPNPQPDALPAHADVMVVLGGGALERPRQAWKLSQEGRADRVIVTGDGGSIVNELLRLGMPQAALIHETEAKTTLENAEKTAPLLEGMKAKTAILVTTWSHARRAQRIFERKVPGVRFYSSFEQRPEVLYEWDRNFQRNERLAALYLLFFKGIWCF